MSYVMNVMLGYDIMEEADARMSEVNAALKESSKQEFGVDVNESHHAAWQHDKTQAIGGYKAFEHPLHLAAFNYVTAEVVLEAVAAARWEYPQHVQVFICDQEDDVFTVHGIDRVAS